MEQAIAILEKALADIKALVEVTEAPAEAATDAPVEAPVETPAA